MTFFLIPACKNLLKRERVTNNTPNDNARSYCLTLANIVVNLAQALAQFVYKNIASIGGQDNNVLGNHFRAEMGTPLAVFPPASL